jgi:hypothetical protein
MPDAPKTQHRSVRVSDDDWTELGKVAAEQKTDRGTLIKEFIAWYLRRPKAKLPARP